MSRSTLMISQSLEIIYYILQNRSDQFFTFPEIISIAKREIPGFEMCYSSTFNGILQQRLNKLHGVYRLFNFDSWDWLFTNNNIPETWEWPNDLIDEIILWTKSNQAKDLNLTNLPSPSIIHSKHICMDSNGPVIKFCFPLSVKIKFNGEISWYWEVSLNGNPKLTPVH